MSEARDAWLDDSLLANVKETEIRRFAARLRSNIHRSADRAIRHREGQRRPCRDDQIMAAWVRRRAMAEGACPVTESTWDYDPGYSGPTAVQTAIVGCLIPSTDSERRYFAGLNLPREWHTFRYIDPDWRPNVLATR